MQEIQDLVECLISKTVIAQIISMMSESTLCRLFLYTISPLAVLYVIYDTVNLRRFS